MSYRPSRRLIATLRALTFPNFNQSITRQLVAFFIAAFILIQPAVLMAQRGKRVGSVPPVIGRSQSPTDIGEPLLGVTLTTLGTPYTQNFDTLPASGSTTWTNDSNIPGWFHARTGTGTTIVANDGSSNAGNLYSYGTGTATDRALGSLGSGNAAIGNLFWGVRLQNNTGVTITALDVSYAGEQWRNSAAAAQTVSFSYLVGSPTVTGSLAEFQSAGVAVPSLDFTSPITGGAAGALNGNLAANRTALTFSITGLSIPNGTEVMLRWSDPDHTGADHGLSIDDFSVTPQAPDAPPSVSSTSPLDNATGIALNSDISVTFSEAVAAPAGAFSISCNSSGAHGFVLSTADNITFTLNPTADFVNSEVCTVTVDDAQVTDADAIDPPNNMTADYVFDFTTVGALPTLSINDVTQGEGNLGTTAYTFTVSLNTTTHGGVTFDICTADGTAQDDTPATEDNDYVAKCLTGQTIPNGSDTYQFTVDVNGDATTETNETFFVNITNLTGATPSDAQGQGTITNDDIAITPIHDIQGNGATSPLNGTAGITTTGIVTLLRTSSNAGGVTATANGFFLQDPNADGDQNTSEGIFVFTSGVPTYTSPASPVAVGDELRVTGTVTEFTSGTGTITEITSVTNITSIDTGNTLPTAVTLDATILDPAAQPTQPQLEKYEGMRMFSASLKSVAPNDQFFDVYTVLSSVPRSMREPGIPVSDPVPPDPTSGTPDPNIPIWDENPERLKVDFNGRAGAPNNFYTSNVTFTNVTGPLDFAFSEYRLVSDAEPSASANMTAVPVPTPLATEFTVVSYNIENFNNSNATQRQKVADTVRNLLHYPDVIGVIEIDDLAHLQALRDEINNDAVADSDPNPMYEAYLVEGNVLGGGDQNQNVGFLVKTSRLSVTSVTQEREEENYVEPGGGTAFLHDRPPLVLDAIVDPSGANPRRVLVVVNHLRSFIDAGLVAGDGPRVREKRKKQAESLADLLNDLQTANPDVPVISVGDYNAYQFNSGLDDSLSVIKGNPTPDDQIVVDQSPDLVNPNFTNLTDTQAATERYSFIFDGTPQALDHHVINTAALARNTRIAIARVNSDFPEDPASAYAANVATPERNSDHDPVVSYYSLGAQQAAGSVLISEFRFRGPDNVAAERPFAGTRAGGTPNAPGTAADNNEFIEVYNNTNSPITVSTSDGSAGWAIVAADGVARFIIPNGTIIPARGHFLGVNLDGYSLNTYAAPDQVLLPSDPNTPVGGYGLDIPDGSGIALFRTANPANYTLTERLDAVGYASAPALYREGTGFQTGAPGNEIGGNIEYSFLRTMTRASGGLPKDTGDNVADFMGVGTSGEATSIGQNLGAPGPENLASPTNRNAQFGAALLDPAVSSSSSPNRVRVLTPHDCNGGVAPSNCTSGTMSVRRTFTNNTGAPVTRLRFRIVEVTTFTSPPISGQADLRAITSVDTTATVTGVGVVQVRGTTLEQPPTQSLGGGWNSSLSVSTVDGGGGMAGSFDLNAPLNVGESINVQFMLGVQTPGRFFFFLNIEADNGCVSTPAAAPCPVNQTPNKPLIRNGRGPR